MLLCALIAAFAVAADQISKYLVLQNIEPGGYVPVLEGVFHFTYIENNGAAFGMLSEHRWIFMVISAIALVVFAVFLVKYKPQSLLLRVAVSFVIGGGAGNMIDRCLRGSVVDFIDVDFINFYVFNIADAFVCVGCGLLILYMLIYELPRSGGAKKGG